MEIIYIVIHSSSPPLSPPTGPPNRRRGHEELHCRTDSTDAISNSQNIPRSYQLPSIVCPAGTPFPREAMAHGFLHLREGDSPGAVVVGVLAQPVVASEAMDVAGEGREESSSEDLRPRADDGLHHPEDIRIDSLEGAPGDIVVQESEGPAVSLEGIPAWVFRASRRLLALLVFVARDALDETVLADSLGVIG
jgi:hypothetical protein